ncbi:MAG: Fic family protein [Planctomycetes bacterium]|nr:Fic family protein [Planctomycetota bacterium]
MDPFHPQLLPIPDIDWPSIIPMMSKANRSLANYNGVLESVPNPEILLSPLTVQEAVLSSKIEGTQATVGEVYRFEAGDEPLEESKKQDIYEIVNYRQALRAAVHELSDRPFNLNLLRRLHEILLNSVRGADKDRGRFRRFQNWIGAAGSPIENATFVPPAPEHLPELLDNWEKYYHSDELDYLVQLALLHAQFEIIHPFNDGNGRLGRMVIPLFLYEKGILQRPMFYLSGWLEANKEEYINHLRPLGFEEGAWDKWVLFFLRGLNEQAGINTEKARAILNLYQEMKTEVIELTHSPHAILLLDRMFDQPVFRSNQIDLGASGPTRQAIASILRKLRDGGIITVLREGRGQTPTTYAFSRLINLCEGRDVIRPPTH